MATWSCFLNRLIASSRAKEKRILHATGPLSFSPSQLFGAAQGSLQPVCNALV
jgi:hypothetical protein